MTTYDLLFTPNDMARSKTSRLLDRLRTAWGNYRLRRRYAHTVMELSQLDARLLRDIGLEPLDIEDALNGRSSSVLFDPMRR